MRDVANTGGNQFGDCGQDTECQRSAHGDGPTDVVHTDGDHWCGPLSVCDHADHLLYSCASQSIQILCRINTSHAYRICDSFNVSHKY